MSTAAETKPAPPAPRGSDEITVVSHSSLFYWWPVWAVGYLMAAITFFDHELGTTVPRDTTLGSKATGTVTVYTGPRETKAIDLKDQDIFIAPDSKAKFEKPYLQMSPNKSLGVVYAIVLLLVITITNVPLRGLWSLIVIVVIVMGSIIFALLGIWENIISALNFLDIRINFAGYLFISSVLLFVWLVVFFLFDRQVYMVFTPGSMRVKLEIGDGETAYDTTGLTIQKQRSDLFRHWILGLGSGDLIVKTSGAASHHFDLPNVLSLGRRVKEIEELLRTRMVVAAPNEPK